MTSAVLRNPRLSYLAYQFGPVKYKVKWDRKKENKKPQMTSKEN